MWIGVKYLDFYLNVKSPTILSARLFRYGMQSSGNLIFRVVLTIQRVSKEGKETFDQTSWENLVHCAPFKESQMHTNMLKFLRNPVVKKPI